MPFNLGIANCSLRFQVWTHFAFLQDVWLSYLSQFVIHSFDADRIDPCQPMQTATLKWLSLLHVAIKKRGLSSTCDTWVAHGAGDESLECKDTRGQHSSPAKYSTLGSGRLEQF